MSGVYEEVVEGETILRFAPGIRHESVCVTLHERIRSILQPDSPARLLEPRSIVQISPGTFVRPDLALVTRATNKTWLIAEIINSEDHRTDTVVKKQMYEELNLPRLWMIDLRYDNVEVYHGTPHGLALQKILAGRDILQETALPGLNLPIRELFAPPLTS